MDTDVQLSGAPSLMQCAQTWPPASKAHTSKKPADRSAKFPGPTLLLVQAFKIIQRAITSQSSWCIPLPPIGAAGGFHARSSCNTDRNLRFEHERIRGGNQRIDAWPRGVDWEVPSRSK